MYCQISELRVDENRINYHKHELDLIEEQNVISLNLVESLLENYPPNIDIPTKERSIILLMLDQIFHQNNVRTQVFDTYLNKRMEKIISEIVTSRGKDDIIFWKLYNAGFIVKTKSVTIAFDFVRGYGRIIDDCCNIKDDIMRDLVEECDILFISHRHKDHADIEVAQEFINQGKIVVAPPDLWENLGIYENITHLYRSTEKTHRLELPNGKYIETTILPGHQRYKMDKDPVYNVLNNITVVKTLEDFTMVHTGDQDDQTTRDDLDWIENIRHSFDVDVLMVDAWPKDLNLLIKGINPKLIFSAHENELHHSIDHREPYWLSFRRFERITSIPYVIMTWGESFVIGNVD